jgi:allophanate hydrolase
MRPSLDLSSLRRRFLSRELTAGGLADEVLARIADAGEDRVWIERVPAAALRARAALLDSRVADEPEILERLPLFGVPFAVKDNIDVEGLATTAACPGFAYRAQQTAPAVERLLAAGALLVGKANLDQFATGLVGTRSPYGTPRNPFDERYIPGGSSSGSPVVVSGGLATFPLHTDTPGSGRVPASFTNIVGLKPTRGRVSMRGVVPACRSLDCVSVFALTCDDAAEVLRCCGVYDDVDPFARRAPDRARAMPRPFRFAVPREGDLEFFGDSDARRLFAHAIGEMQALGGVAVETDITACRQGAELLYDGPWVAERLATVETLLEQTPDVLLPQTRQIISAGARYSAVDAFKASYRLAELRRAAERLWEQADFLLLPTAGTIYRVDEIEADPLRLNSRLGIYTNFVNLFDLSAVALPAGFRSDGLPWGVSCIAPAFAEEALCALGAEFQQRLGLPLGATGHALPAWPVPAAPPAEQAVLLAVAGAHLSDMPLNGELVALGARFVERAQTAPSYRMFLLEGAPLRPGLLRDEGAAHAFEIELWSLAPAALGGLVAAIAPPLSIGTIRLSDGREVKGFLCESAAASQAQDISDCSGWREFLRRRA